MKHQKIFSKPFDLMHYILFEEFPGLYTHTIWVPGIFVEKLYRWVRLNDGTGGEMDSSYIADSDGIFAWKGCIGLEHQFIPICDSKLSQIGNYDTVNLYFEMAFVLLSVITIVIDAFFDDEGDYRRLINMMGNNTSAEAKHRFDLLLKSFFEFF